MWGEPDPDPGGDPKNPKGAPSQQEVADLKDQNEQHLLLIAQLKEMLRKDQSSVSQEKVEEYVNTLSKARAKKSRQMKDESGASQSNKTVTANIDSNKKERINLLRQQMEENKARLAERGKSQKGIEKMVTEFQAQLNDSQQFASPFNLSFAEVKTNEYNENTSQKELYNILITKERKITELMNRSQKLEGTVLDLQENLKEKDSVIDARTKAITLMTESLSKKGKSTLDTLDETKEQMRKMQENFVTLESEMKARQLTLLTDLKSKNMEISDLQETNEKLKRRLLERNARQDEVDNSQISNDFKEELNRTKQYNVELLVKIKELENNIESSQNISNSNQNLQKELEKTQANNKELLSKISDLESNIESLKMELSGGNLELKRTHTHNQELLQKISDLEQVMENKSLKIEDSAGDLQEELEKSQAHNRELLENIADLKRDHEQHLLDDLEVKNRLEESYKEIADILSNVQNELEVTKTKLKEHENQNGPDNSSAKEEIDKLTRENVELDKQLQEALADLILLKSTGMSSKRKEDENKELEKLKKQLDESNKSMIKMRAQQKGKIKELNKKLEQFKKMNDANALITQLQNENSKLSEKVAELEEEKGNMQLKMVESSGSSKDPEYENQIKSLEDNLSRTESELLEKDKVIEILESELLTAKQQLKDEALSTHVSSEMSSIQYEEQLEKVEEEKRVLQVELESVYKEKNELLETIELLKKEKQDLNAKLENYIQENMELIDKLEKLSAEKVSSAESIEMVEGLTQQEKLELAAYQKIIGQEEVAKCTEDDHMESPVELNESVLQLSEDTAELLQKIEMFTRERKEVMQKMDGLKEENNLLNAKVKEIENNRDILAETYEQLQNEKEAILTEKEELAAKLNSASGGNLSVETEEPAVALQSRLKELQIQYEALLEENNQLKRSLKDLDSKSQEKFNLEDELKTSQQLNNELEVKLKNHIEEIHNYELIIEDNKNELINSSQIITNLQNKLQEREKDIDELNTSITDLNTVITELQNKNSNYELMQNELEQLKSGLTDQLVQAQEYEAELNENGKVIRSLNNDLAEMNRKLLERLNELEVKESEINKLKNDIQNKDEIIRNLQSAIEDKDKSFKTLTEEIKTKYLGLQQQLDLNSDSLQKKVDDLQQKNKEQLEKMKKIAANLKKKTQTHQELEKQYNDDKEKWESDIKVREEELSAYQQKTESLLNDLQQITLQVDIIKTEKDNEIALLQEKMRELEQNNVEQQNYILNFKHKEEKLREVSLQKEMSASLQEKIDNHHLSQNLIQEEKLRELEMMLETRQSEMQHYIERIQKLEETIRNLDEEKSILSSKNLELEEKLSLTSNSFKEKALLEDQLELKLAEVTATDEALSKKLYEITREHEELVKKHLESEELIKKLKIKLKKSHDKVNELKANQLTIDELKSINTELKKQISSLEASHKQILLENESLRQRNMSDYEKIEADYQIQLEELLKAKNDLTFECEKLREVIKEFEGKEEEFLMEIDEYKLRAQDTGINIEEINRLNTELETVNGKLHDALAQIGQLNQEISILMDEIEVLRTAKFAVEEIVQEAVEKVSRKVDSFVQTETQQEGDNNQTWPNQASESVSSAAFNVPNVITQPQANLVQNYFSNDPNPEMQHVFEPFVQTQNVQSVDHPFPPKNATNQSSVVRPTESDAPGEMVPTIDNSQEALIKKMKALEFLLFNVDKENVALTQCAEMVSELADMIYEKANISQSYASPPPSSNLESQIISDADLANLTNKKQLETLEYQPVRTAHGEQSQPVQEEISARKAYVCHEEKANKDVFNLDAQIMSQQEIDAAAANVKQLQNIEYQKADKSLGEQRYPIIEPVARSQQAYLCYAKDDKQHSLEAFEENDDGWGWGPEEGRLEEEHMSNVGHIPQVRNLQLEIESLKENIKVMKVEREHHLDEIKQLQIKSGKLVKKCKELKLKTEQLSPGPSTKHDDAGFFDLNETIQEELKQQVEKLEKKLKEITLELEKEKAERNNLLKKVDVLSSANDRMVEMKEIQDSEVHRWQRKYQEAREKLDQYEWGSDEFGGPKKTTEPGTSNASLEDVKVQELEQVIRDLSLDNEELQSLLEEQRNLRLEAEKKKEVVSEKEIDNSVDLQRQIEEQTALLASVTREVENIKSEKETAVQELYTLKQNMQEKDEIISKLQENKESQEIGKAGALAELQFEQAALRGQIQTLHQQLTEKDEIILQLQENKKSEGIAEASALAELQFEQAALRSQIQTLHQQLTEKDEIILQLQENRKSEGVAESSALAELQFEQAALRGQIQTLHQQLVEKDEHINQISYDLTQMSHLRIELENQIELLNEDLGSKNKLIEEYGRQVNENTTVTEKLKHLEVLIEDKEDKISQLNQMLTELRHEQSMWEATENQLKNMIFQKDKNIDELLAEKQQKELENQRVQSQENQSLVEELKNKDEELAKLVKKLSTNESLLEELKSKEKEIEDLTKQISDKDKEFEIKVNELEKANQQSVTMINELNASWQIQVDQRGAEVAELWKNHLVTIENDFAAVQKKLMFDVSELEERCNILVNENNELRKNVDAEIRNEVDKLSALHQQIASNQHTIAALQTTLQEKQNEIEVLRSNAKIEEDTLSALHEQIASNQHTIAALQTSLQEKQNEIDVLESNATKAVALEQELESLKAHLAEKEKKISSMGLVVDTTQKQFDEKRKLVEEIVSVLERNLSSSLSYDSQDILNEFNRQLAIVKEHETDLVKLKDTIKQLEKEIIDISGEKDRQITGLNQVIEDFERELSVVHEKDAEIFRLSSLVDKVTVERNSLAQELQQLQHDHSNCQTVLENNIQRLDQLQTTCNTLEERLQEKETTIEELNSKISDISKITVNDSNKETERLCSELQQCKQEYSDLYQHLTESQSQVQELSQNLTQRIQDYDTVSQQLNYYQQTIAMKDEEINRLQANLQDKEVEYNAALSNVQQTQYNDVQNYYEQQLAAKDYDNQSLHAQLQELENANRQYGARLEYESKIRQELEEKLFEHSKLVDEDTKQMEELKLIIEDQVVKIEELKKELFEKSSQYDSIIAEMDMGRPVPVTHQPVASSQEDTNIQKYTDYDLSEPVSRAEQDLTLYMLHQRDVRCEELTVELTHLLEERDTLQLRLSNAIREKEELRRKLGSDTTSTTTTEPELGSTGKSSSTSLAAEESSRRESSLATKLSELKIVGYKKDKTFVDEQDARRLQQLSIMQQHIKEASKLPAEAAAKLVDASYTLSRDVQSPSKVLLNWLWGNSTPKAGES